VISLLKLVGQHSSRPLLAGGRCSKVVANSGLTVVLNIYATFLLPKAALIELNCSNVGFRSVRESKTILTGTPKVLGYEITDWEES
jgi:hypothetical protein